jgi:hypothetical protein
MSEIAIEIKEQVYEIQFPRFVAGTTGGGAVAWNDVTGKPATFPPSAHTHPASEISDSTTAGRTILTAADAAAQRTALSLGNVDNTSDANKPISSATQTALNGKANTVHTHVIADVTGLQTLLDDANGTKLNQATVKIVRKASAGTITKGQVVYIVGSQGSHLTVELADADSEATAATTIGVAMGNITSTVDGYIIVQGFLDGLSNLPTATFTDGAALWLSSTAGGWTTTRPTQPAHGVFIGWVVSASNGAAGRAYIKVINGQELDELHDVLITSPTNDQVLAYETSSGLWKNKTASSGGITNGQSIVNALIFG